MRFVYFNDLLSITIFFYNIKSADIDRQVIKYDHFKISSLPQKYEEFWKNLLSKNILENDVFSRFEVKNVNFCIFLQVPGKGLTGYVCLFVRNKNLCTVVWEI